MKVPTYQQQTTRTAEVGTQQLRVRASGQALAAPYQAAARAYGQAADTAMQFYGEQLKQQRDFQREEKLLEASRRLNELEEESKTKDAWQSEKFYEDEVAKVRKDLMQGFDTELRQKDFGLRFDALRDRSFLSVKKDARSRQIDKHLAISSAAKEEHIKLMTSGNPVQQEASRNAFNQLLDYEVANQYITEIDAAKARNSARVKVRLDKAFGIIEDANSIEELEAIQKNLEENQGAFADFTAKEILELQRLTRSEISAIRSGEAAGEAALNKLSRSVRDKLNVKLALADPREAADYLETWKTQRPDDLNDADYAALLNAATSKAAGLKSELKAQQEGLRDSYQSWEKAQGNGGILSDEAIENIRKGTASYGTDDDARRFDALYAANQIMKSVQGQGIDVIEAALQRERDRDTSKFDEHRLASHTMITSRLESTAAGLRTALESGNAIEWYRDNGGIDYQPIQVGEPESIAQREGLVRSLQAKNPGYDINFLTSEEASVYAERATSTESTFVERTVLADELSGMPMSAFQQIAGKGAYVFAMASAIDDDAVRLGIFKGQDVLKDPTLVLPDGFKNNFLSKTGDVIGDVYYGEDKKATVEAVYAYYMATRTDASETEVDESDLDAAITAVTGGIAEFNGRSIELPRNVGEEAFEDWISNLNASDLSKYGALAGNYNAERVIQELQNGRLALKSIGANQYVVTGKSGLAAVFTSATEEDGRDIVVDGIKIMGNPLILSYDKVIAARESREPLPEGP